MCQLEIIKFFVVNCLIVIISATNLLQNHTVVTVECMKLRVGQYICPDNSYDLINPKTQQPWGCTKENRAKVLCRAADGIICKETNKSTFWADIPCKWTNGYYFDTTLLLSVFLGMFGVDRFYLGYYAIGFLKFCTFGFLFVGHVIDVVLIATQIVGPADGSHYIIPYYGPNVVFVSSDNSTHRLLHQEWAIYDREF